MKISEIAEEEVVDEEHAVDYQALLLLARPLRKGNAVSVVFGRVLGQSVEKVHDLST